MIASAKPPCCRGAFCASASRAPPSISRRNCFSKCSCGATDLETTLYKAQFHINHFTYQEFQRGAIHGGSGCPEHPRTSHTTPGTTPGRFSAVRTGRTLGSHRGILYTIFQFLPPSPHLPSEAPPPRSCRRAARRRCARSAAARLRAGEGG